MSGAGGEDRADGEGWPGTERAAQERAAEAARRRREFIRDHHPDRGGDAESFIAGLRVFDAEQAPGDPAPGSAGNPAPGPGGEPPPRVVVVPHQAWLTRLVVAAVRRLRHGRKPARVR